MKEDERKEKDDASADTTEEKKVQEESKEETKHTSKQDADVKKEKSGKNKKLNSTSKRWMNKQIKQLYVTHVCLISRRREDWRGEARGNTYDIRDGSQGEDRGSRCKERCEPFFNPRDSLLL